MHDIPIHSNLKAILVALPMLFVLLAGFFRLDQLFAAPKRRAAVSRPPTGIDEDGAPILCDPDGRRQPVPRPRRT
ncbi:MAG: hypothetical protein P4K94_11830 [Terracidiphilus sp.]|nr:hypothetical protein [Terracidiphilus sp.]